MSEKQPQGNYYNKYESKNIIEKKLMQGFFNSINKSLDKIKFENVLEAGCGEWRVTDYIKRKYDCNIEGFDIGETAIEKAKESFPDIPFYIRSIYKLPYKEEFDLVVCCEVLEHLDEYEKALEELFRVSKRYVLISVPSEPLWRCLNLCRFKYIKALGNTPGHVNHWNNKSFKELLSKYGKIIDCQKPLPWQMILLEKRQ